MKIVNALKEMLADAEADMARTQSELVRLQQVKQGLEYAIERAGRPKTKPTHQPNGPHGDWPIISRAQAVERILRESDHPLSPTEIVEALKAHGRTNDARSGVSAVLTRLKTEDKARNNNFSRWEWVRGGPSSNGQRPPQAVSDQPPKVASEAAP